MSVPTTLSAFVARYLAEVTPRKAASTQRHDDLYSRALLELLDPEMPIAELSPPVAHQVHQYIGVEDGHPVLANRILSFISQVCDLAERHGARPPASNPTRAIRVFAEHRATSFLTESQRPAFIAAARECVARGEVSYSAALLCLLMMLAGLRWSSARGLLWSEVDLDGGVLRLRPRSEGHANKAGDQTTIPITDDIVEMLRSSPRVNAYVAPNRKTGLPYVDVRKALARINSRAGVDVRPHGLRHTFGTALAEAGLTEAQIGACMGHASGKTASRYIHLAGRRAREALLRASVALKGVA